MVHLTPRAPSGGLAQRAPSGRIPANPERSFVTGMENAIHGAVTPVEGFGSRWLLPGVIPAEIILGNVLLLMRVVHIRVERKGGRLTGGTTC